MKIVGPLIKYKLIQIKHLLETLSKSSSTTHIAQGLTKCQDDIIISLHVNRFDECKSVELLE